jgi:hypothetical protein
VTPTSYLNEQLASLGLWLQENCKVPNRASRLTRDVDSGCKLASPKIMRFAREFSTYSLILMCGDFNQLYRGRLLSLSRGDSRRKFDCHEVSNSKI